MKKKVFITIVIIVLVVLLGVQIWIIKNKKDNTETKTIKVNEVTRSVFYAPQYVAINNGYFKEEGMEIELTTGQGADAVMTSVLSNQCDIGFAGPEASIYVYNEGKTIIPGRKGGVPYMTLEYVLKENGIEPGKDVTLDDSIKFDLMAGAFASGNADYVTLFEPTASQTQLQGKGYIVASVGEAAGEIPYTAYFAKKSYIEKNEETIQGFTNAIAKGEKWVKEHSSKEIAEAIQSFFPSTDIEMLTSAIQSYKDIDAWNETPVLKQEGFERLQEVMTQAGELKEKAPYEKIVNNKYSEKAEN